MSRADARAAPMRAAPSARDDDAAVARAERRSQHALGDRQPGDPRERRDAHGRVRGQIQQDRSARGRVVAARVRRHLGARRCRADRSRARAPAQNSPRSRRASASGAPAPTAPTAVTAARLEASSAPRFAGMNADAKLATRENVSTASAPVNETGDAGRAQDDPRLGRHRRVGDRASPSSARRAARGLPRTRSSSCRSTAPTKRPTRPRAIDVPNARSMRSTQRDQVGAAARQDERGQERDDAGARWRRRGTRGTRCASAAAWRSRPASRRR